MWLNIVNAIIPFAVSTYQYDELIGKAKKSRDLYCAHITNKYLGDALVYSIVHDNGVKESIARVSDMVDNVQLTFFEEINKLEWMDEETRAKALEKLNATKIMMGFPDWMNDPKEYRNVTIMDEHNFLKNIVSLNKQQFHTLLENYRKETETELPESPLNANAYNNIERNTIGILAGSLQFPFYQLGLESLNYGAIGRTIGHEFIHGFDNRGKEYDRDGLVNDWWTKESRNKFEKRARCFINRYTIDMSSLIGIGANAGRIMLSGTNTLNENIADNGGLRIAFHAYKNYIKKYGTEKVLPGFTNYSNEQMFFLAYAHSGCERSSVASWMSDLNTDVHSPLYFRVLIALKMSKEFAEAWKCPKGSPMNPERENCQIW